MAADLDKDDEVKDAKVRQGTLAGIAQFFGEVRTEVSKVTWPTRKETGITSIMVFLMVVVAMIFFIIVDTLVSMGVRLVLGLGG